MEDVQNSVSSIENFVKTVRDSKRNFNAAKSKLKDIAYLKNQAV